MDAEMFHPIIGILNQRVAQCLCNHPHPSQSLQELERGEIHTDGMDMALLTRMKKVNTEKVSRMLFGPKS